MLQHRKKQELTLNNNYIEQPRYFDGENAGDPLMDFEIFSDLLYRAAVGLPDAPDACVDVTADDSDHHHLRPVS